MTNLERNIATLIMGNKKAYRQLNQHPMHIVLNAVVKTMEINQGISIARACEVAERNIKNYAHILAA